MVEMTTRNVPEPALGFGARIALIVSEAGGFDLQLDRDPTSSEPVDLTGE